MSDSVQQIKYRLNIIDVISPYVELHKAGKNFKGKSPFSAEKTPSFYVSPDRGMYYCFSTSQGGDIFTFIEAMEGETDTATCVLSGETCDASDPCALHDAWSQARDALLAELDSTSVADA